MHWLLSHKTVVETIHTSEIGITPAAMTGNNLRKEYWPNRKFEPATYCSEVFYATDWAIAARRLRWLWKNLEIKLVDLAQSVKN